MIRINNLTKSFGERTAVDQLTLEIDRGEVFGFLGPNGAGKTTLIMMLSTLLEPTSGSALVNGHDIRKNPQLLKREMGILFQDQSLDERLTGFENLMIQTVLHDIPKGRRQGRVDELLSLIGLDEWADAPVASYSGGMRRRLEIARSLVHHPKILLLDEPTLGLDPTAREAVWRYIAELREMTVVLATNYIEEAERLCHRVAIMDSGKIVAQGTPGELKSSLKIELGEVTGREPEKIMALLEKLDYIKEVDRLGRHIQFSIEFGHGKDVMNTLSELDTESIEIRKATLNDVFFKYTGRTITVPSGPAPKRRGRGRRRRGP